MTPKQAASTYFGYLRQFELRYEDALPVSARYLFLKLLRKADQIGWGVGLSIPNTEGMRWLGIETRAGLTKVRKHLVEIGLLSIDDGVRGRAPVYHIELAKLTTNQPTVVDTSEGTCQPTRKPELTNTSNLSTNSSTVVDPIVSLPSRDLSLNDRVERARGTGRRDLPNPYPLDVPDAVRDRSARLAAWAAGPPLHISNGAKSPKWMDACAEFDRLDIPDDDIKGFITRRTAETHREAAGRGETAEPIHSLAYHAVALTQWAQTYDPTTTAPVSGRPKRDRGFLSDADSDAEQIAGALAWRQRNAKNADTDPPESG